MSSYEYVDKDDVSGGMNLEADTFSLQPNELRHAKNIVLYEQGGFRRRYGLKPFATYGTHSHDDFIEYERYDEDEGRILEIFSLTYNGEHWVLMDISDGSTAYTTSVTTGQMSIDYEVFNNKLYVLMPQDTNKFVVYDGNSWEPVRQGTAGTSISAVSPATDISSGTDNKLQISVDGDSAEEITLTLANCDTGDNIAAELQTQIQALGGNKAGVTVKYIGGVYKITSGSIAEGSAVVITNGTTANVADDLKLGVANGGTESTGGPSSDSNLATIQKCKYLMQRGQRLFAAGNFEAPNILYYSEVGDPTYFKEDSLVQAVTDDGDVITALYEFHGSLVVFKERAIFAWFGFDPTTDVEFQRLSVPTGTAARRTIKNVDNVLFFLGIDGVYALTGLEKEYISAYNVTKHVSSWFNGDTPIVNAEDPYHNRHCAVYRNGIYYLSVARTTASQNDSVLVLYGERRRDDMSVPVVEYTGWNVNSMLFSLDGTMYLGSSGNDGKLFTYGEEYLYDDVDSAIIVDVGLSAMEGPDDTEAYRVHRKKFRRGYIRLVQHGDSTSHVTVKMHMDYSDREEEVSPDESGYWGDSNWGECYWGFSDIVTRRFNVKETGLYLLIDLYDDTPGEPLTVLGLSVERKIKKPSRSNVEF